MTNYRTGHDAEKVAAKYLKSQGFKILGLNWQNRYCEIDIIAQKDETIYFVEVKYRATSEFGTGLDYIIPKKLKQMGFAAEIWIHQHEWPGDYQLAAMAITGSEYQKIELITDVYLS